ncbi:Rho GTPase activation protein [Pseudovirgaria hyperparasitica]|uniref:Rho GTPase activation protein n=1 Tax=Pseudovirgaria hyperparasitica TaxID=470096 RepID=A0A6A6WEC8_9PEZI|nr:Rho GTPase activation protein [Pseudovirgaria hyperparasitica]KAF2759471.1 Rho GTPase activation protein [Pseudovirgaria hyperparasitica]
MRAHLASRLRSSSLSAVPPPQSSSEYSNSLAKTAASILYRSPIPSQTEHPIYILNAAAFPDADEVDFDKLLPYVLARLPGEEELITGTDYEVIFFAGGNPDGATSSKKNRPGWGWFIQAYHVLSRAMRKRLQKLYIVHERSWVRILVEMFSTIVSPKFRRKIVHVSSLTSLGLYVPLEDLLIPPSAYLHDRRLSPDINVPYASGRRAFAVKQPFPKNAAGGTRLPRVLRETTTFLLMEPNVKTEGIFRVPPHARLREILREAYDRGQKFIVWKDYQSFLPLPKYPKAQDQDYVLDEVDQKDAYNVLLAAGLIKLWYSELRQPLFPDFTYRELKTSFKDPELQITVEVLTELISPTSEWSKLPMMSREILVRHLLPLLSIIASRAEENKMTAENLAVCFAPALVCGPDQLEDAKISSMIRRILTAAIELWSKGLAKMCGVDLEAFPKELLLPSNPTDWEDPLEAPRRPLQQADDYEPQTDEKHFTGIIMQDNDDTDEVPPPLPPRGGSNGRTA